MIEWVIVLVNPKYAGNVGSVARSMMNFGFSKLTLINPPSMDSSECKKYASHASAILDSARIVESFEEAIEDVDFLVGTSARIYEGERVNWRTPAGIRDFTKKVFGMKGRVGIVFGPEDFGLSNKDLSKCDLLISIPTSEQYPSMNLSHAVHLVLWEIFYGSGDASFKELPKMSGQEKEKFFELLSSILEQAGYPKHKREITKIMMRRIMGRALVSEMEYHRLMGTLQTIKKRLD
jgi:TrmH family RNA methyltransferase